MAAKPTFANIAAKAISSRPVAKPAPPQIQIIAKPAGDSSPAETHNGASAKTPTDDTSTHVSSSESSVKLPSFDKQSVASGTTFAMDEKESLRPDDSASLRAVNEDEDGPSTGPAGSRVGSDTDARAFSDQLHRIERAGNMVPPRAILQPGQRPQIQFGQMPMNGPVPETPIPEVDDEPNPVSVGNDRPMVDEKLLEALASVRDRVFILKVEQDILDFMKNEKEAHLTLPDCNSFYRMLSHRLADYYGLDHTHHPRDSGTAVLISKLPSSRVPPPLAGIPVAGTQCSSPPPPMATRKIMRRGEVGEGMSGPSTTANSEGPSKAASEIGEGSKDKSNMTREEREKRYADARLRILGSAEPDPEDAKKSDNDNDLSRSSSASGKKKSKPKQRKDDEDFETRSQFPYNYNAQQQYGAGQYAAENAVYFPSQYGAFMTTTQQYASMAPTASPQPTVYSPGGYGQMDGSQYMPFQQYIQQTGSSVPQQQSYPQQATSPYDLSSAFSSMNLGAQNQSSLPQKPAGSPNFVPAGQMPQAQQGWSPYGGQQYMGYDQQQVYGQYSQSPAQTQPYAYGQLPNPQMHGSKMQHPLPGSFNRQQFNPSSQPFVPGGQGRGGPMQMPGGQPMFYGNHVGALNQIPVMNQSFRPGAGPQGTPQQGLRPSPVKGNTGTFPSPAMTMQQPVQPYSSVTPTMHFNQLAPGPTQHQAQMPPYNQGQPQPSPQPQRPMPGLGVSPPGQQLTHPLPSIPNQESSIAKWGTPASLPPKPPTPTDPRPAKFIEMNKGRTIMGGMGRGYGGPPTGQ